MADLPPELKHLKRFIREAKKTEKVAPVISHYCRLYAIREGLKLDESKKTSTTSIWLGIQMSLLEENKVDCTRDEAQQKITLMAHNVFKHADKIDRAGNAINTTAAAFNSAFVFYTILKQFGDRDEQIVEAAKYCMFKTYDILKALKEGRKPKPGPPDDDPNDELKPGNNDNVPQYNYQKRVQLPSVKTKIEACIEAEKLLKEAMAALRFEDVDCAITKMEEAIESIVTKSERDKENITSQFQQQNLTLIQRNDDLTAVNSSLKEQTIDQRKKYNLLLEKYNKATRHNAPLKQDIMQKKRDCIHCNELRQAKDSLSTANLVLQQESIRKQENVDLLTKQNDDLNEECKELKIELQDIKNKYNKWVQQNSDYTTWDCNTIVDWIINLDKQFIRYEDALRNYLKEEEITGGDLIHLNKNDLGRFGIKVFKHKQRIMEEIQKLISRQQINNMQHDDNIIPYNEGKKETEYIAK